MPEDLGFIIYMLIVATIFIILDIFLFRKIYDWIKGKTYKREVSYLLAYFLILAASAAAIGAVIWALITQY